HTNSQIHSANAQTEINSRLDTHSSPRVVPLESSVTKTKSSCILKMLLFVVVLTLTLQPALSKLSLRKPSLSQRQRCVNDGNPEQYETFLTHHLNNNIPNNLDINEWQTFIDRIDTWHRGIQSFFPEAEHRNVLGVCSTGGKIYPNTVNLCISKKKISFYNVYVNYRKQVKRVKPMYQYVILGCEKIVNKCRPIHFEANRNNAEPDNNQPNCSGLRSRTHMLYS
ncbi:hypothetical protein PO909_028508, partial [Leuciscus waleckii]